MLSLKLDEAPQSARHVGMMLAPSFGLRKVPELSDAATRLKAGVTAYERILLAALQYDLTVQLPYGLIHSLAKTMSPPGSQPTSQDTLADRRARETSEGQARLVRHGAQSIAYGLMSTLVPLVYTARAIAIAALLASAAANDVKSPPAFDREFQRYPALNMEVNEVTKCLLTHVLYNDVSVRQHGLCAPVALPPAPPPAPAAPATPGAQAEAAK